MTSDKQALFHTPELAALIAREYNNAQLVKWDVGGFTVYGIVSKRLSWKQLFILPFGLYLPRFDGAAVHRFLEMMDAERKNYDSITFNFAPGSPAIAIKDESASAYRIETRRCHVVQLDKPLEELIAGFSDTRRKHIRRVAKRGILKVFQTTDKSYFEKYFGIYLDSLNRWREKSPAYSREFIIDLHKVPNVKLWVAEVNGDMMSGMICLYGENCVFDWLAASIINKDVKKLYSSVAVQYAVIEDALKQNLEFVNMGASDRLEGVKEFKESWNAGSMDYQVFVYQKRSFRFFKKIQYLLPISSHILIFGLLCEIIHFLV